MHFHEYSIDLNKRPLAVFKNKDLENLRAKISFRIIVDHPVYSYQKSYPRLRRSRILAGMSRAFERRSEIPVVTRWSAEA